MMKLDAFRKLQSEKRIENVNRACCVCVSSVAETSASFFPFALSAPLVAVFHSVNLAAFLVLATGPANGTALDCESRSTEVVLLGGAGPGPGDVVLLLGDTTTLACLSGFCLLFKKE